MARPLVLALLTTCRRRFPSRPAMRARLSGRSFAIVVVDSLYDYTGIRVAMPGNGNSGARMRITAAGPSPSSANDFTDLSHVVRYGGLWNRAGQARAWRHRRIEDS